MRAPPLSSTNLLLASAVMALAIQTPLGAQGLRYSGSLGYSSGSYVFSDRTESLAFLNGLTYSRGRFSLSATVPVISQNSGDVSFLGGGMMPTGDSGHHGSMGGHSRTGMGLGGSEPVGSQDGPQPGHGTFETNVGDPLLRGSYQLFRGVGNLRSLSADALLKAPVAPVSSGIGTGAWDLGVGASSLLAFGEVLVLAGASMWSPGDLPDVVLKDYVDLSLGVGRLFGRRWSLLSSLNLATSVIETIEPPASAGLSFGFRAKPGRSLNGGISVGLSEASPDFSVFLGWSVGFLSPEVEKLPQNGLGEGRSSGENRTTLQYRF